MEEQNLYEKHLFGGILPAEREGEYRIGVRCDRDKCRLTVYRAHNRRYETVFSCGGIIGANGTGKIAEGDMKTPLGTYTIGEAYGIKDDPGSRVPYTKITDKMYWRCDSACDDYNTLAYTDKLPLYTDFSHDEHLVEYDGAYNYLLDIGYNMSRTPYAGSAVFLHCIADGKATTSGCIAIAETDMIRVLRTITIGTQITIY